MGRVTASGAITEITLQAISGIARLDSLKLNSDPAGFEPVRDASTTTVGEATREPSLWRTGVVYS